MGEFGPLPRIVHKPKVALALASYDKGADCLFLVVHIAYPLGDHLCKNKIVLPILLVALLAQERGELRPVPQAV